MSIPNVSNNGQTNSSSATNNNGSIGAAAAAASIATLSVNDFLSLMTAQLQNQDPTQPLDPSTFVTQLAQFGTVSGIDAMQSSLSSLSSTLLANQALSSASLVGHSVMTQASTAQHTSGQSLSGAVQAPTGASGVVVNISNGSGTLVQQINVAAGSGLTNFTWDGTDLSGAQAPAGSYTVQAIANVNGVSTGAPVYLSGTVSSVSLNPGGGGITLNTPQLGAVPLANVQQVN
jgi:flagellar basal-body rod modification protein FlgD